jgi:PAS domain S-box-containing protein
MIKRFQNTTDITHVSISKKRYIPTRDFYSHVIDSIEDYAVLTLDLDLTINSWNSGASKIFQYTEDEIIGKKFHVIFTQQDRSLGIPEKEIRLALDKGKATDNRWHQCKDNSKIFASGLVFPLISDEEEHIGFVKILQNKTQSKKAEDAIKRYVSDLEELNTHKDDVLAILSHDLRSPLAATIAAAEYLDTYYDSIDDKERKEIIALIHASSKDELNMLDYLLEWARIKYASQVFTPRQVYLFPIVTKILAGIEEQAAAKSIQIVNEVKEDLSVFADSKMLISIFQNLISNALSHTTKNGIITVRAKKHKEKVIVEINDTGKGMPPEMVEKMFKPSMEFLSLPRKDNKGGGIGLLLVKGFLEKNRGTIWVESQEKKGTSFYFSLPIEKSTVINPEKEE